MKTPDDSGSGRISRVFLVLVFCDLFLPAPILAGAPLAWATQAAGWRQVFVVVGLLSFGLAFASRAWVIETPAGKVDRVAWVAGLASVLKNRATWPGFFANAGLSGAFFAFAGLWAVPYLTQMQGMTRATASTDASALVSMLMRACGKEATRSSRSGMGSRPSTRASRTDR